MLSLGIKNLFSIELENIHCVFSILGIRLKFRYNYFGYKIRGKGNKIIYVDNGIESVLSPFQKIRGLDIYIEGDNNIIKIAHKNFRNTKIEIRNNDATLMFKETKRNIKNLQISVMHGKSQYLEFGKNVSVEGAKIFMNDANSAFIVGDESMLSAEIVVWATDGHSIIDKKSQKLLNQVSQPVRIGDYCWIGYGVYLLKGANLPNHTIVGANSVVVNGFNEEYTIVAGNPAKIVRKGVEWDRKQPAKYLVNNICR